MKNLYRLSKVENYDPYNTAKIFVNMDHVHYMYEGTCKGFPIVWIVLHNEKIMVLKAEIKDYLKQVEENT